MFMVIPVLGGIRGQNRIGIMQISVCKTFQYCHHHEFDKPSHTHARTGGNVEVKKSGTREIKVVRRVLDVNEKMAKQKRPVLQTYSCFV